jgi:hypothetical protein
VTVHSEVAEVCKSEHLAYHFGSSLSSSFLEPCEPLKDKEEKLCVQHDNFSTASTAATFVCRAVLS